MSESNDERSPGFNKSLTTKLIAVGLFVVLGTAGVAYYLNSCRKGNSEANKTAQLDVQPPDEDHKNPDSAKPDEKDKNNTGLPATTRALKPVAKQSGENPNREKTSPPSGINNSFSSSTTQNNGPANSFSPSKPQKNSGLPPSKSFAMPKVVKQSGFSNNPTSFSGSDSRSFNSKPGTQKPTNDATNSVSRRFQQMKQNSGQFANQSLPRKSQANPAITDNTSNSLRSFGGSANTSNPKQLPNSNRSFNQIPATPSSKQSALPPIKPASSFDASKDLKPFAPSNVATPQARPQVAPTTNNLSNSPRSSLSSPQNNNLNAANSRIQNVSTNPGSRAPATGPSNSITKNVPGDRKLEGLQAPSITIEKIAPREIQVNKPADFQLVVKNVGRIPANNVMVYDQIPTGTDLIQSVPQPQRRGNGQVSWELDTLGPGQEKRIKLQLRPTTPGEIGSVAQVSFSAMASMRTKVTKPVLAISHTISPRVLIGDRVVLEINVTNEGDGPATDVLIQEDLPEGLSFSEGFRELEYAVGTLGPGQSRKIRLELKAAKIGKYRNVMVARADGGLQAQHAVDLEVIAPTLQATGEGPTRRFLNRKATHRFAVRNSGTASATNVELICRLPNGLRYVSANNRGKYDENSHSVYWSLAELNAGLVANVELTTMPFETGNQDLKFEAISDLNQKTDAICKLNVEHLVDVFFDIDDVVDPIEIGSDTSYKLRIENQGTKTATNVQLQVDFPPGIQPTAVEGNINSEIRGQQIAFQPITSLNPGDEVVITIRGKGITAGDHRVAVSLIVDGREVNVSKQESTRVYSDR